MIFTSEMMHGWMVIMNVMDHVLGFYFICATKFKKKSLRWIWWSEVSFMYRSIARSMIVLFTIEKGHYRYRFNLALCFQ